MQHIAYTDGSFILGCVGYGAVLQKSDGSVVETFKGRVFKHLESRQVTGELYAVRVVLEYCQASAIKELEIRYDYLGVEYWPQGLWHANKELTIDYIRFVHLAQRKGMSIKWTKIKAHSADPGNDRADALARLGAELPDNRGKED